MLTTPTLLSPQAAFNQANLPLDITRRDQENWSDIELAALDVAVGQAKDACLARVNETYKGSDLVAYARLCALGKQWKSTYTAATHYINSGDPVRPLLTDAYALEVQADLNLGDEKAALGACIAMLHVVPYGPLTDAITTATVRYMQFAFTLDAATLLSERQPFLLKLLQTAQPGPPPGPATDPDAGAPPTIPTHILFEHALDFAALELYDKQPSMAKAILRDLDGSLPASLPPDEAIPIAADRLQYALIGTHFPALPGAVSLASATETSLTQPRPGSAVTIFLLFPPWCVQCIRQVGDIDPVVDDEASRRLRVYALLADDPPAPPEPAATKPSSRAGAHRSAAPLPTKPAVGRATVIVTVGKAQQPKATDQLRKTPTFVVAPSTLADFNASDYPFLIVTDHDGIIRLMVQGVPNNALKQNGPIDQIADFIAARWPPPASSMPMRPIPPPPPRTPAARKSSQP